MIAVLLLSLTLLLATFGTLEFLKQQPVEASAQSDELIKRINAYVPVIDLLDKSQTTPVLSLLSSCHRGHTITPLAYDFQRMSDQTTKIATRLGKALNLNKEQIKVGHTRLLKSDFSYHQCAASDMTFPIEGLVISIKLASGLWFNSEVHPHEWHTQQIINWILYSGLAFFFIGGFAIWFIAHLNRPLNQLTRAAQHFAQGMSVAKVEESGPPDIRRTISAFNMMQQQVAQEITRRTQTLAAISHDIRTPLTALRIKVELIDDEQSKQSLIGTINKMEKITASALEFLKGADTTEPMRPVDLSILLESECLDFSELGEPVTYHGKSKSKGKIVQLCRPDALVRAVRNLIENAVKYGGGAMVNLIADDEFITISVSDHGPGIEPSEIDNVVEPFKRLSKAREGNKGGFGLGLAVVKAVAQGHNAKLTLAPNKPTGLVASITLTRTRGVKP
ncbi:MAG: ATP-binding protein [Psychrosphaera sp.]|nr:ATP-binding protein [Psychrosphaera sp.]